MSIELNSLRMRAEKGQRHISGAERLLSAEEVEQAALQMLQRALEHPRGRAEKIHLTIEAVCPGEVSRAKLLDLQNNRVTDWSAGRDVAVQLLAAAGVARAVSVEAINRLSQGAAPDGNSMRGAMLINVETGERLESDQYRGVRASRMDLTAQARLELQQALERVGLNNSHVVEAMILATKVVLAPGAVAELCWSDDPDYQAGYVASRGLGYQRISLLKPLGEERGGRVFFVRCPGQSLTDLQVWLEKKPLLIDRIGQIFADTV